LANGFLDFSTDLSDVLGGSAFFAPETSVSDILADSQLSLSGGESGPALSTEGFSLGVPGLFDFSPASSMATSMAPTAAPRAEPLLSNKALLGLLLAGGLPLGATLLGSQLGASAGADIERRARRITGPTDLASIMGQTQVVAGPSIARLLEEERERLQPLGDELIRRNVFLGSPLIDIKAREAARTNRMIAELIANLASAQQARAQEGGFRGLEAAQRAAATTGAIPSQALTTSAILAALLLGKGGILGG
jgi:hypothetical protein